MIMLFVTLGLIATLIAVIFFDLRQMRIPNQLSFILISLFIISAFTLPPIEIATQIALAAIIFVIGFFGFMFRLLGGGDVKILATLALFVPLDHAAEVMLVFSAALLVGTALVMLCRTMEVTDGNSWAFLSTAKMPMGLPIGFTGLASVIGPLIS